MQDKQCITGFTLKVVAIAGMTANHVAHVFIGQLPVAVAGALFWLGGVTFPVMAFLLVEGYRHTSNLRRYMQRLLIFACVAQVPYTLLFGWTANVLFTLAIGLAIIWARDKLASQAAYVCILVGGLAVSLFCDWGVLGPLMILLFCELRTRGPRGIWLTMALPYAATLIPSVLEIAFAQLANGTPTGSLASAATFLTSMQSFEGAYRMVGLPMQFANTLMTEACNIGYALVGFTAAGLLLCAYNGRRGRPMKWLFYAYYPAHLAVIWLVKLVVA
ncbi:MAG: conjugal transfer protein TraX [Eggerthellaceae bacterium]|nr:conjugal transfer protein TraX [Eggerthellaceae bacterium]